MTGAIRMLTEIPGPRSRELLVRKEHVVADPLDLHVPAFIAEASGARVTDVDGNVFLDFSGGLGCHIVGHSHPKVVEAVQRAAARFSHTDFSVVPYEGYVELAERLVRLTGIPDGKVALFNNGAEAIENAVKFAKAATGRGGVLCFEGAFHGRTLLTMTMTSRYRPYKQGFGPFAPEVYRLPYPYPFRSPFGERAGAEALASIERALGTMIDPSSIACAVVEPVQGEGGFIVPTPEFLPGLAELLGRHGILLVADEVQSGCGRTGRFLACEHFDVHPDIVVLAKSIASGYPLAAVVARAEIMDAPGPSAIGGTYVGNPVACAAGNAALQVIEDEALLERAERVGKVLRTRWDDLAAEVPRIGEVRGLGAMVGVEFVTEPGTREPDGALTGAAIGRAMRRGVIAVSCGPYHNVLRHLMPLVTTDEELDEGLDVLTASVAAAAS